MPPPFPFNRSINRFLSIHHVLIWNGSSTRVRIRNRSRRFRTSHLRRSSNEMTSSAFDVDGPLSRMLAAEGSPSSNDLLNELKATNTMTGEIEAEQLQKEAAQRPNEAELRYAAVRTSQYAQGLVLRQKERAQDEAEEALAAVGAVAAFAGGAPQSLASSNLATLHKVNPTPAPAASPKTTQPGARRASAAEHVDNFGVQSRVSREDEQVKRAEQRLNERMEAMRLSVDGDDGTEDMLRRSAGLAAKGDSNALSATDPARWASSRAPYPTRRRRRTRRAHPSAPAGSAAPTARHSLAGAGRAARRPPSPGPSRLPSLPPPPPQHPAPPCPLPPRPAALLRARRPSPMARASSTSSPSSSRDCARCAPRGCSPSQPSGGCTMWWATARRSARSPPPSRVTTPRSPSSSASASSELICGV